MIVSSHDTKCILNRRPLKWILLCLTLVSIDLSAQSALDSLLQIWRDQSQTETDRADAYLQYIGDYYVLQLPDSAEQHYLELADYCVKQDLHLLLVEVKEKLGYHFFRIGKYADAIKTYDEGLRLAEEHQDTLGTAYIILKKGWLYHDNGQRTRAVRMYQESLRLFEKLDEKAGIASVYNELGSIYREDENFAKSLEYYQMSRDVDSSHSGYAVESNLADLYLQTEQYEKGIELAFQVVERSKGRKDKLGISSDLSVLGALYLGLEDRVNAAKYLHESLTLAREINDVQRIIVTLLDLAAMDLDAKDYQLARNKCEEAKELSQSIGDLNDDLAACECLYDVYKEMGNGEKALTYLELITNLNDTLQIFETSTQLQQMEFNMQLVADSLIQSEKDLEREMLYQADIYQKEKNRNIAIAGGAFFLLAAIGFFIRSRMINKSRKLIREEKDLSDSLLLNILPAEIAAELKATGKAKARSFDQVSILFTDFKNFTSYSSSVSPEVLVEEINDCFQAFDQIVEKYGIEKIKTIGDAYMAAGGLPVESEEAVRNTVLAGLEMQKFIIDRKASGRGKIPFEMRLGIHTGLITAGVVGVKKFQYDVWGDTVNTAARMESAGQVNCVNISQSTYEIIADDPHFSFEDRGEIEAKGKGLMRMYFVKAAELFS